MVSVKRQWNSLLNKIDVNSSEQEFYKIVSRWLIQNEKYINHNVWENYGLGRLSKLNPSLYKINCMVGFVAHCVERWNNITPSSQDSMAMIIRDNLWDIVVFKTQVLCPNCCDDDLRALFDPDSENIILSCDICCWSQLQSGEKYSGSKNLVPASKEQLLELKNDE